VIRSENRTQADPGIVRRRVRPFDTWYQPAGVKRGNWIQTDPAKGWLTILRVYSPLEPFFARAWRLSEIEAVH